MSIYRVVKNRTSESEDPIQLKKGDLLRCMESSDSECDWPNWIFCKYKGQEGWVPSQIIRVEGNKGLITENYDAREFTVVVGEIYCAEKKLNGWIWAYKEGETDSYGWVPLNCVEEVSL